MKCPNCGKNLWFIRNFCVFCKTAITAPPRPKSVAVIGWLGIISGIGTALVVWIARDEVPLTALACVDALAKLIGGAFILRGMNWARWVLALWLVYGSLHTLVSSVSTPSVLGISRVLLFALAVYYLFRPAATAFFTGAASLAERLPNGEAKCRECGKVFPVGEMVPHDGSHVCAACKPSLLQKISEGVPPGVPK